MKIALIGYGQMGKMIENLAPNHSVEVVEKYWDEHLLEVNPETQEKLADVDVLIDFSTPYAVLENIGKAVALKKSLVVGTTGWFDKLDQIRIEIEKNGLGFVYASNFSLGVNLFYQIVRQTSKQMAVFESYCPFIEESHHQFKKDAPSGTALVIKNIMQPHYDKEIPVTSVRAGYIPGTHAVSFDSRVDTIELKHTARNREGFAEGALIAAKWIKGKKGLYDFPDVVSDLLKEWQ